MELAILLLQTKVILGYTNEQIYVAEPMINVQSSLDHSSMGLAFSMQDHIQVIFIEIPDFKKKILNKICMISCEFFHEIHMISYIFYAVFFFLNQVFQ